MKREDKTEVPFIKITHVYSNPISFFVKLMALMPLALHATETMAQLHGDLVHVTRKLKTRNKNSRIQIWNVDTVVTSLLVIRSQIKV